MLFIQNIIERFSFLKIFQNRKSLIRASLIVIFTYILLFFTSSGDIKVNVHDNLDSNIAMYKVLADTDTFFASNETLIPQVMNGLPRIALPSELKILTMLYYIFEPADAYMINELVIRLIAFFGMLLLLERYFVQNSLKDNEKYLISIGTSLIFALLPYWSNAGASIAGQPLVLYAFLNIKNRDYSYKNFIIFIIYPFYSSLILAGMFFLFLLTVVFIVDVYKSKKINYALFLILFFMSLLYLLSEYRLVTNFLDPLFISHREEFLAIYLNFGQAINKSAQYFIYGQYHAHSFHTYFLLPLIAISALAGLARNSVILVLAVSIALLVVSLGNFYIVAGIFAWLFLLKREYIAFYFLAGIVFISLFAGFINYEGLKTIKEIFPLMSKLQFDRFYFLFALLWFLLFAISSRILVKSTKIGISYVVIVLFLQVITSLALHRVVFHQNPTPMKYYYSEGVFNKIKIFINKPLESYRVLNIGMEPAISIYNGFYTLDAYLSNYPLEYKHQFRKIIAPQLDKNKRLTVYYDTWGSRCRLMDTSKNISLDIAELKKMGGKYIFSSYMVNINNNNDTKFIKKFSDGASQSIIFLYEVL